MGLGTFDVVKGILNNNTSLKKMSGSQFQHLREVLLEMLKDVDGVCRENNINYMLGGGSCLGAVRHNGFIPWDDDVDLNMTRLDYKRLRKVFSKKLGDKYVLQSPEDSNSNGLGFVKIRKKGTVFRGRDDYDAEGNVGICIDIFVIENTYDFIVMRYLHGFLSLFTGFCLSCRNFFQKRKLYLMIAGKDKRIKAIFMVKIVLGFLCAFIPVEGWVKIWNGVNKMCKNNKSKYVTVPTGRKHFFGDMYFRKGYCEYQRIRFENLELPVPKDVDGYMKKLYGNYMEMPEKSDREAHVFLDLDFGDKKD